MILSISHVASAEQSVNNDTSNGTLSTFSRCGRMFSMPLGSFALNLKSTITTAYENKIACRVDFG